MKNKLRLLLLVVFFVGFLYLVRNEVYLQIKKVNAVVGELEIGAANTQVVYYYNRAVYNNDLLFGNGAGGLPGVITAQGHILINLLTPTPGFYLNVNARSKTNTLSVGTNATQSHLEVAGDSNFQGNMGVGIGVSTPFGVPLTVYGNTSGPALVKLQGTDGNVTIGEAGGDAVISNDLLVRGNGDSTFAGRVGINTTAPGTSLQVVSSGADTDVFTVRNTAVTASNIFRVSEGPDNQSLLSMFDGAGNVQIRLNSSGTSYLTGGNIGIGTTNPGARLDVRNTGGTALIANGSSYGVYSSGGTNYFAGNVGIGTATTTYKLDVNGPLQVRGSSGNITTDAAGNLYAPVALTVGSSGLDGTLRVYKNSGGGGRNNLVLTNGTPVAAGITKSSVIQFKDNNNTLQIEMGNDRFVNGTNDFFIYDAAAAADRLYIDSSGNTGIGTTNPVSKLEIASGGSIRLNASSFEGAGQIQSSGLVRFANGGSAQGIYAKQISISDSWADNDTYTQTNGIYSKGNMRVGGATLSLFASGSTGNVGIGNTSPGQKLTITGTGGAIGIDNTAILQAKNAAGTYETFLWPRWSDNVMYMNYGSAGFNIRNSSSASTMFMTSNGNVGIGSTAPGYKLDVAGNTRSTGTVYAGDKFVSTRYGYAGTYNSTEVQGIWSIGDAYQINTTNDDFGNLYGMGYAYNQNGGSPIAGQHQIVFANNGAVNAAIALNGYAYFGGNVGIGSTAPSAKLDVSGGVRFTTLECMNGYCPANGVVRLTPNLHLNSAAGNAVIVNWDNGTTGTALTFRVGNGAAADVFDILANGNVGMGTTAPDAKLDIFSAGGTTNPQLSLTQTTTDGSRINFLNSTGTAYYWTLFGQPNATAANAGFNFYYSGYGNVMTAKGNGNVGIGSTVPVEKLDVNGWIRQVINVSTGGTSTFKWTTRYPTYMEFDSAGLKGINWFASLQKYKKNITDLEVDTSKLYNLKLRSFHYNWQNNSEQKLYGFIAEEVAQTMPELAVFDPITHELKNVNYGYLPVLNLNEIQKHEKKINALQKENADLKEKINTLETRMDKLEKTLQELRK